MCYTVQGPRVESLINHPVCRPALSIAAEWPLFRHCCLLHVNKKSCGLLHLHLLLLILLLCYLGWPQQQACSRAASFRKMKGSLTASLAGFLNASERRKDGDWRGCRQQGQGQGGLRTARAWWSRWENMFVFGQAALLWPGQCNVSLTSVANLTVCSLSPIK